MVRRRCILGISTCAVDLLTKLDKIVKPTHTHIHICHTANMFNMFIRMNVRPNGTDQMCIRHSTDTTNTNQPLVASIDADGANDCMHKPNTQHACSTYSDISLGAEQTHGLWMRWPLILYSYSYILIIAVAENF